MKGKRAFLPHTISCMCREQSCRPLCKETLGVKHIRDPSKVLQGGTHSMTYEARLAGGGRMAVAPPNMLRLERVRPDACSMGWQHAASTQRRPYWLRRVDAATSACSGHEQVAILQRGADVGDGTDGTETA